ncbi:alcohol dehydrogenase catalytic domain-containing protein [Kosakonia sp. ML.JS2a]|nr:alcohol dehydrogenase catalytic domain-containing protein [Kosakonia sp. ML.JS2a]
MKAISLIDEKTLGLITHQHYPLLPDDSVEIDIVLSGICGTDLAVLAGREEGLPGIIRGHEAVGVVVNVGNAVTGLQPGMRVVIDPNEYCGRCAACRSAHTHLCTGGQHGGLDIAGVNKHGMFAERFITRMPFVYPLPDAMSWETAVLIEPVACILNNIDQAEIQAGERVLVLGSGPMSLVAQLLLRAMGVKTLATDLNPNRIQFGRSLGLDVLHADELGTRLQQTRVDAVIDTVGNQLDVAMSTVRRGGRVVLFGFDGNYTYPLPVKHVLVNAIRLIGAGEYNQHFPRALQMASMIPALGELVTHRYTLDEYAEAFDHLLNDPCSNIIKCVFTPNEKYL